MAGFCAGSIGTRLGNCPTDAVKGTVLIRKFTHYGYSSSDAVYDGCVCCCVCGCSSCCSGCR